MNARELTTALNGRWYGSFGMVCCPSHPDRTPSLIISNSDKTKDSVTAHCFAGCDWRDVKDKFRLRGLLSEFEPGQSTQRPPRPQRTVVETDQQKLTKIEYAKEIWRASLPAEGTHAETYLHGRCITIPIPPTIKSSPALKHGPTGLFLPTMIAAISREDKKLTGVHRTYLRLDGSGKATVAEPKLALGRLPGDAVRLGPAEETIGISEGIETGLSAMQLYGGSVWCACGSHLGKVALPDTVKHVRVYADNGEAGEKAAAKAVKAYQRQGRDVTIISPPPEYGDFNNILTSALGVAA